MAKKPANKSGLDDKSGEKWQIGEIENFNLIVKRGKWRISYRLYFLVKVQILEKIVDFKH